MSRLPSAVAPGSSTPRPTEGPRPTPRPWTAAGEPDGGGSPNGGSLVTDAPARVVRPRPVYLPALDGLRAISVAAVVAYHLGRLGGGFLGVDVFFVISGFLITRLLLAERERTGTVALRAFWARRFRRLLPALLVVLAAVAVLSRLWLPGWRLGGIRLDAFAALGYVANWRFVISGQSYFSSGIGPSPLRHMWSLAIEEQFYLVWPLVVLGLCAAFRRRHRHAVFVTSGVLALGSAVWMAVLAGNGADLTRVYYGTDTRLFALCAGAWLATWWDPVVVDAPRPVHDRRPRTLTQIATGALVPVLVLTVIGVDDQTWFYRGGFQAVTALTVVAIGGLATGEGPLARVLSTRLLLWIGRRSYGIYLWSWPVQLFLTERFDLPRLWLDGAVIAVTVGLATVSYHFVEEPIRTGRRPALRVGGVPVARRGRRERVVPPERMPVLARSALSVTAVVAVIGVIVATSSGASPAPAYLKVTDQEAVDAALSSGSGFGPRGAAPRADTSSPVAPAGSGGPATTAPTAPTAPAGPTPFDPRAPLLVDPTASGDPVAVHGRPLRVMIAGDSVGWSLGWHLGSGLTPSVQLSTRAIVGCGLMPDSSRWVVGANPPEAYGEWCTNQAKAEEIGLSEGPDVVLLWVGAWEVYDHVYQGRAYDVGSPRYARFLEGRLQARIDRYRALGIPTVVPEVPCFGKGVRNLGRERYDARRIRWVTARFRAVAARNRGWVRLVDPTGQLCTADGTARPDSPTGIALRADGAHFDEASAEWFWNSWLAGQLGSAFAPSDAS